MRRRRQDTRGQTEEGRTQAPDKPASWRRAPSEPSTALAWKGRVEIPRLDREAALRPTKTVRSVVLAAANSLGPRRKRLRLDAKVLILVGVGALGLAEHRLIDSSVRLLAHVGWVWLGLALELESASIAMLARMQRQPLRAGHAQIGIRQMLATTYVGNAISVWVPLAGSQLGVTYAFRRLKRLGVDSTLAGWAILISGVASSFASAVILVAGAILSGNDVVALTGAVIGGLSAVAIGALSLAIRRPGIVEKLERVAVRVLQLLQKVRNLPHESSHGLISTTIDRLRSFHLRRADWARLLGLAFGNWLADAGVLAVSLFAVGAGIPWHGLLFAYGAGAAVGSLRLTPGGLGVVEGTLTVALMGVGVSHGYALPAVLLYRFISFWMVSGCGLTVYLLGHRGRLGIR